MTAKHTPGPWNATQPNGPRMGWRAGPAWLGENPGTKQAEANALLIAAAPDLLDALVSLSQWLAADVAHFEGKEPDDWIMTKVTDALKKAGGES